MVVIVVIVVVSTLAYILCDLFKITEHPLCVVVKLRNRAFRLGNRRQVHGLGNCKDEMDPPKPCASGRVDQPDRQTLRLLGFGGLRRQKCYDSLLTTVNFANLLYAT